MEDRSENVLLPKWLWAAVGGIALLLTGGLGTWAGSTLTSHETRLTRLEAKAEYVVDRIDKIDAKLDWIVERLSK